MQQTGCVDMIKKRKMINYVIEMSAVQKKKREKKREKNRFVFVWAVVRLEATIRKQLPIAQTSILFLCICHTVAYCLWTENKYTIPLVQFKQTHTHTNAAYIIRFWSGKYNSNLFLLLVSSIIAIYLKCIPFVCVICWRSFVANYLASVEVAYGDDFWLSGMKCGPTTS